MRPPPLVLAHRGWRRSAPENTLGAFEAARGLGVDGVEFDVRTLADGAKVLHHDPFVRRLGKRHPLEGLDLASFRRSRPGAPTLDEALAWAAGRPAFLVDVELKDARAVPGLRRALDARRTSATVVTSFDLVTVKLLARDRPRWRIGWISKERDAPLARRAADAGAGLLVLHRSNVRPAAVADARDHGLGVWVWGVDWVRAARRFWEAGVEAFITDAPRRLLALRRMAGPEA